MKLKNRKPIKQQWLLDTIIILVVGVLTYIVITN